MSGQNKNKRNISKFDSELLVQIIDGSSIASFVIDSQHKVAYWNTAMEVLSGIKREDILGTDGQWQAFYREKRPAMADLIADGAGDKEIEKYYGPSCKKSALIEGAYEAEEFFPDLDPEGKWLRFTASPIKDKNGKNVGVIETLEDVTQRKIAEENLHYYLKAVTSAQEEERKRIARELHDDTAQFLGSLSRELDNFIRKEHGLSPENINFLKDMLARINEGVQNIHRFSQKLRLSVLDDLGLIPALRSLVKTLQDRYGITARFQAAGEAKRYSPEVETAIFRIVQEATTNIGKHSQATEAEVIINFTPEKVHLTISDNGRGFSLTEPVDNLPRIGKLGLAGIRERVHLLGGTINIQSSPGNGTRLEIEIPVR